MLKNTNMNTVTNTKENIFNASSLFVNFRISNANEIAAAKTSDVRDANIYKHKNENTNTNSKT